MAVENQESKMCTVGQVHARQRQKKPPQACNKQTTSVAPIRGAGSRDATNKHYPETSEKNKCRIFHTIVISETGPEVARRKVIKSPPASQPAGI